MHFMEKKAAERHPDCLIYLCSVASLKIHEDAIQSVVVQFCKVRHESLQLQELQDAFYGEESSFKAPRSPCNSPSRYSSIKF